jgi:hypothetical protein
LTSLNETELRLALLSMTLFALRAGLSVGVTHSVAWALLALAGLAMSIWFLGHCTNEVTEFQS